MLSLDDMDLMLSDMRGKFPVSSSDTILGKEGFMSPCQLELIVLDVILPLSAELWANEILCFIIRLWGSGNYVKSHALLHKS